MHPHPWFSNLVRERGVFAVTWLADPAFFLWPYHAVDYEPLAVFVSCDAANSGT